MSRLRTDSPLSRRIVTAFLQFLSTVEPGPGVDVEGLEVSKECLADVFKINLSEDTNEKDDLLVSLFGSTEVAEKQEHKSDVSHENLSADAPNTSTAVSASHANKVGASRTLGKDSTGEVPALGVSEDELFGQFCEALEKIQYFMRTSDGHDDQDQLDKTSRHFYSAITELKNSVCQTVDAKNLAETFKTQGNKYMQSKHYSDAIDLYTYAIALCEDNAIYYCNRAAAYTQIKNYEEAINDSYRSIRIDPRYGKAYSRIGYAYHAQGNYSDAIYQGFLKALELDPSNESIKANIRAANQKLREQERNEDYHQSFGYAGWGPRQETGQQSAGGSRNQNAPPPFTSMPFNNNGFTADFGDMFMNMASNFPQSSFPQEGQQEPNDRNTFSEPGIGRDGNINLLIGQEVHNINLGREVHSWHELLGEPEAGSGGNVNINVGEQMPEEISGALRSVMQMFSGTPPHANTQNNNANGGSAPN